VTAEEGALMGGAGDAVMEVLADAGVALPVMRFGIPDEFIEQGTQKEIYELLGLTPQAIEAKVRERLAEIESNKAQA
ncbi:MAG: 1-deoxy-D-xylulose-5-phosphate synthase, partial [Sutterella wadsworthensis]|nr:1-deoxy-D-xylulose-5-phosphate synthase [Sutterella wadsworthensis]